MARKVLINLSPDPSSIPGLHKALNVLREEHIKYDEAQRA